MTTATRPAAGVPAGLASDFDRNQWLACQLDDDGLRPALMSWARAERVVCFPSAHHPLDDPAPAYSTGPGVGHRRAWLVAGAAEVAGVLRNTTDYGNAPYAEIGGGGFMLALDPLGPAVRGPGAAVCPAQAAGAAAPAAAASTHARQRRYVDDLLNPSADPHQLQLEKLAVEAVRQAGVAGLQRDRFDLASFAEQAALRFCGLAFGFATSDQALLQAAAAAGYRALVHQIVGRHFSHDPIVLPQARQAMGLLTQRVSTLIEAYRALAWRPREVHGTHRQRRAGWPEGVDPLDDWGLGSVGEPWLKRMALSPGGFSVHELATMAVGLIVGTVGNVQAAACLVLRHCFCNAECLVQVSNAATRSKTAIHEGPLHDVVQELMRQQPPVAFLPRRARCDTQLDGEPVAAGDDLILWLAASGGPGPDLSFGLCDPDPAKDAPHSCLGTAAGRVLVTAVVGEVLRLPSVGVQLDPVTGEQKGLKQRWGFACTSYPLEYRRSKRLAQQPLNVVMRVKSPVEEHAQALRRVIRIGAPRIERALKESRHVHFAWFELLDQGRWLALHTVYDGNFDAYVQHFALQVDDLFDQLFQHIDGAPPLPVAENPGAFVDVIRAHNAPPAEGYFFSAYPETETAQVLRHERNWR